ncbi:MAG: murein transglycosylase A [Betaproteobacteria bacterium]|nr:murein transglycosylase A [Betaproteobacteria bacterium]
MIRALPAALVLWIAGCAAPPQATAPVCPACPVCTVCAPAPTAPVEKDEPLDLEPAAARTAPAARGKLERVAWDSVPQWGSDSPKEALAAFQRGCTVLSTQVEWKDVCQWSVPLGSGASDAEIARFFREAFDPWRVVNLDGTDTGLLTGYYEPLLAGSRVPTRTYKYPIYRAPSDLIAIDLGEVYADLKFRRLRGRLVDNKLVPYFDRAEIDGAKRPLRGLEIVWVDDPVELHYLQIQGSGQIALPDGTRLRVGYAEQNGHPFRSVAGLLIRRGEIKAHNASLAGIRDWARRNPKKAQRYLDANPSYVFFKELPLELPGPIGTQGVPLTAERSIAIDPRVIPLGVPLYLSTTHPTTREPLNRLMVAQDTGGAIAGAVRGDFYWGTGDSAGQEAGRTKQPVRMWVLLPKGMEVK